MLKIEEFLNKYSGKVVGDHQGGDVGECVSVNQLYQHEVGWPIVYGNARDWWYNPTPVGYVKVKNYPWTIPHPSDFAVFDIGKYGHTGVVLGAGLFKMKVVNQNYPLGSGVHVTEFNYIRPKCLGFLRKI